AGSTPAREGDNHGTFPQIRLTSMDRFVTNDLHVLTTPQEGPCVSVFLPTHVSGEAGQQDAPRLKHLLNQAEEQLVSTGLRPARAREMLQPARQLPEDV